MILIPDVNKIMVFNRGTSIGLKGLIPIGGQVLPISMDGEILLCRKAQKNDTKNKISEIINKIIPILILLTTFVVWWP